MNNLSNYVIEKLSISKNMNGNGIYTRIEKILSTCPSYNKNIINVLKEEIGDAASRYVVAVSDYYVDTYIKRFKLDTAFDIYISYEDAKIYMADRELDDAQLFKEYTSGENRIELFKSGSYFGINIDLEDGEYLGFYVVPESSLDDYEKTR